MNEAGTTILALSTITVLCLAAVGAMLLLAFTVQLNSRRELQADQRAEFSSLRGEIRALSTDLRSEMRSRRSG